MYRELRPVINAIKNSDEFTRPVVIVNEPGRTRCPFCYHSFKPARATMKLLMRELVLSIPGSPGRKWQRDWKLEECHFTGSEKGISFELSFMPKSPK